MKKDKNCPLCNGKPFNPKKDDQKILCFDHFMKVLAIMTLDIVNTMSGDHYCKKK